MFWHLKNFLFPGICIACGIAAPPEIDLCDGCREDLPFTTGTICTRCGIGSLFEVCGDCLKSPPLFDRCHTTFHYRYPVDLLLSAFKQSTKLAYGETLARLIRTEDLTADLIVPVPLHYRRQQVRGFNQAELIAERLSASTGIPLHRNACKRIQSTVDQKELNKADRIKNVKGIFECRESIVIDKTVLVVDDVVTTGATVNSMAAALLSSGCRRVEVCCVARTEKQRNRR